MGAGGVATAEWLKANLSSVVEKEWNSSYKKKNSVTEAYLAADSKLLKGSGFMGMGERMGHVMLA